MFFLSRFLVVFFSHLFLLLPLVNADLRESQRNLKELLDTDSLEETQDGLSFQNKLREIYSESDITNYRALKRAVDLVDINPSKALGLIKKIEKGRDLPRPFVDLVCFYKAKMFVNLNQGENAEKELAKVIKSKNFTNQKKIEIYIILFRLAKDRSTSTLFNNILPDFIRQSGGVYSLFAQDFFELAAFLEKKENYRDLFIVLEKLALSFPITETSRLAFQKLLTYSCHSKKMPPSSHYHFTKQFLIKLSSNFSLDASLREFLVFAIEKEIRVSSQEIRYLNSLEKLELLFKMRLYDDASAFAKKILSQKSKEFDETDSAKIMLRLGSVENRRYRHKEAARFYSLLKSLGNISTSQLAVSEHLADSLNYGGFKKIASEIYGSLAKHDRRDILRWHHFWTSYTQKNWEKAHSILKREGESYVPPRDRFLPQGPLYWQARVLEERKKFDLAKEVYSTLFSNYSDDIYGYFAASRQQKPLNNTLSTEERLQKDIFLDVWKNDSSQLRSIDLPQDLRHLSSLIAASLFEDSLDWIERVNFSKLDLKELALMSSIAAAFGSYNLSYKSSRRFIIKILPKSSNWYSIRRHQKQFNYLWKAYYPIAYKSQIEKISKILSLDPLYILSIMRMESAYKEKALSHVGARGLMQIMPFTAVKIAKNLDHHNFSLSDLWKPSVNISYGSWYLRFLLNNLGGDLVLTTAAYNAGPHAVVQWINRCSGCTLDEFIESIPYKETRNYVKNVMRSYMRYSNIYQELQPSSPVNFASKLPEVSQSSDGLF